jgi:hypothetical protein
MPSARESVKPAKFYDFLGVLGELSGSKLLSDINLRKPYSVPMAFAK